MTDESPAGGSSERQIGNWQFAIGKAINQCDAKFTSKGKGISSTCIDF
jgi:hypothetical protein